MMTRRNRIGIVVFFCLFACTAQMDVQASKEEETYFKEVMKRRIQGRCLIKSGMFFSKEASHQKVYKSMARYYDRTDSFFSPLLHVYPTLAEIEEQTPLNYIEINDVELVHLLQTHVDATLQLYRGGVMKDIQDEYKNMLLQLMPALVAQYEDLKVLQQMTDINAYAKQNKLDL